MTYKTKVNYRIFEGEVIALFPYEIEDLAGNCTSYALIGQHSAASYDYVVKNSRAATPEEYKDLHEELTEIGYDLTIIKKRRFKTYLRQYEKHCMLYVG